MSRVFLTHIDLNKNELRNARLHVLATAPSTPASGQVYYDSATNGAYVWNGSQWISTDASKVPNGYIPLAKLAVDPLARGNHTGTQAASTISDFDTQVRTNRLDQMAAPTAPVSMNGQRVTGVATPTAGTDAANRQYVDDAVAGLAWKDAVRAATTANITLSGTQTVDGVTLAVGNRVLVKNQTTANQNGVYVVASGAWTRATDADIESELLGMAVMVEEGAQSGTQWVMTTDAPITVGTTSLTFSQFGGGQTYTAGNGLTLSGNDFNVGAGTGITVGADTVSIDTSVVARKYAATIGDGSATSIVVTHNLGNQDTVAMARYVSDNSVVECDITNTSANTTTFGFASAPAASSIRVAIVG